MIYIPTKNFKLTINDEEIFPVIFEEKYSEFNLKLEFSKWNSRFNNCVDITFNLFISRKNINKARFWKSINIFYESNDYEIKFVDDNHSIISKDFGMINNFEIICKKEHCMSNCFTVAFKCFY